MTVSDFSMDNDAVMALSPDASSTKAALGLLSPSKWPTLGAHDAAVWGECQGSGAKPYQTQVDLSGAGPAFRCSCPSRKFPCKHGLALLLLRVKDARLFTQADPPQWVSEWLSARLQREQKKEVKQRENEAEPVDPALAAERDNKRRTARWSKIDDAAGELRSWLSDQVGRGFGSLSEEQVAGWNTVSARLVDGQAPGLAVRVKEAAQGVLSSADWPEQLLHRLGLLQLLCDAIGRRLELSPDMQDELRIQAGWPFEKTEVMERGERVSDKWTVIGQIVAEKDDRLFERRVWLAGRDSGRRALLLDHAYAGKGFEQSLQTGTSFDGSLVFFPGAGALRALVMEPSSPSGPVWPAGSIDEEWRTVAGRVSANPWIRFHPLVLTDAVPLYSPDTNVLATSGERVPLVLGDEDAWLLLACSGGNPVNVMGEWDGFALHPLSAWGGEWLWQRSAP